LKNKKIMMTLALAAVMTFSLAGCGNETKPANDSGMNVSISSNEEIKNESNSKINEKATQKFGSLKRFKTSTMSEKEFNQDQFQNYDVTMVNVWATYCGGCIEELPEIQKLYEELPKNVNIISICSDSKGNEEIVKDIMQKSNIEFSVLKNSDDLESSLLKNVMYVPITIFVDKDGNIVGDVVEGAPSDVRGKYISSINKALESIGKTKMDMGNSLEDGQSDGDKMEDTSDLDGETDELGGET
jgi:thiol-disulfide isomerase/thioredoxin